MSVTANVLKGMVQHLLINTSMLPEKKLKLAPQYNFCLFESYLSCTITIYRLLVHLKFSWNQCKFDFLNTCLISSCGINTQSLIPCTVISFLA